MNLHRPDHPKVKLGDINDVYGFVGAQILKARGIPIIHDPDEAEELICEGVKILLELHQSFEPHMPGYDQPGRFSGYAARFLPRRLHTAWRKLHPEHLQRKHRDGSRSIDYGHKPLSVDFYAGPNQIDQGADPALAGQIVATSQLPGEQHLDRIDIAVSSMNGQASLAAATLEHLERGATTDTEIAISLGVERMDITRVRGAIATALYETREAA